MAYEGFSVEIFNDRPVFRLRENSLGLYGGSMNNVIETSKKYNLVDQILGTNFSIEYFDDGIFNIPIKISSADLDLFSISLKNIRDTYSSTNDENFLYERFTTLIEYQGTKLSALSLYKLVMFMVFGSTFNFRSAFKNNYGIILCLPAPLIVTNQFSLFGYKPYISDFNAFCDEIIALGFTNEIQNQNILKFKSLPENNFLFKIRDIKELVPKNHRITDGQHNLSVYHFLKGIFEGNLKRTLVGAVGAICLRYQLPKFYNIMACLISVRDETLPLIYHILVLSEEYKQKWSDLDNEFNFCEFLALVEAVFYAPKSNRIANLFCDKQRKVYQLLNRELNKIDDFEIDIQDEISRNIVEITRNIVDQIVFSSQNMGNNKYTKDMVGLFVHKKYPLHLFGLSPQNCTEGVYPQFKIIINLFRQHSPSPFKEIFPTDDPEKIMPGYFENRQEFNPRLKYILYLYIEIICSENVTEEGLQNASNTENIETKLAERSFYYANDEQKFTTFLWENITSIDYENIQDAISDPDFISNRGFLKRYISYTHLDLPNQSGAMIPMITRNICRGDPKTYSYALRNGLGYNFN